MHFYLQAEAAAQYYKHLFVYLYLKTVVVSAVCAETAGSDEDASYMSLT